MKNKQIIKLTESDLHQLITESVKKKCLNEKYKMHIMNLKIISKEIIHITKDKDGQKIM